MLTTTTLEVLKTEYARLCDALNLHPVDLDAYRVREDAPVGTLTDYGINVANATPGYSASRKLLVLPFYEGDDLPEYPPSFPPKQWNKLALEWPTWRIELWHETIHQLSDALGTFDLQEPGRRRSNGTLSNIGHGLGWLAAIEHAARRFDITPDALDAILDQ
jgi:hypothetical protein